MTPAKSMATGPARATTMRPTSSTRKGSLQTPRDWSPSLASRYNSSYNTVLAGCQVGIGWSAPAAPAPLASHHLPQMLAFLRATRSNRRLLQVRPAQLVRPGWREGRARPIRLLWLIQSSWDSESSTAGTLTDDDAI